MEEHRPIRAIQDELFLLKRELAAALAFQEAIGLAFFERTGQELLDGGEYADADHDRAEEILKFYPQKDA